MLEEKILNDYKEAMKSRDTLKSSVLSFLRAEMINVAMAKKKKASKKKAKKGKKAPAPSGGGSKKPKQVLSGFSQLAGALGDKETVH